MEKYKTIVGRNKLLSSLLWLLLIVNLYVLCIGLFFGIVDYPSHKSVTWIGFIVSLVCLAAFLNDGRNIKFGFSAVVLFYTISTQFGLNTIYFLVGEQYLSGFNANFLRFLYSDSYPNAVMLGSIAIMTYVLAVKLGKRVKIHLRKRKLKEEVENPEIERNIAVKIGYILISIVIIFLLYYLLTGQLRLNVQYTDFRNSAVKKNPLYGFIIVLYATGIGYVIATGTSKQRRYGLFLYCIPAIILFVTGNKGEVLYAALACIGTLGYRGYKMKPRIFILIALILFVIIPFVTITRAEGVINNLSQIGINFTAPFVEMGGQLRISVFILEEFKTNSRDYIYGFSYYNPIINIIDRFLPFSIRLPIPESFNFKETYARKGFSQVAESYANFGLLGVICYHLILGYVISIVETKKLSPLKSAYFTSIIVVVINSTRNKFAFVPGQIVVLSMFYFTLKFIVDFRVNKL